MEEHPHHADQWEARAAAGVLRAQQGFGITSPKGARQFLARLPQLLEAHRERLPERVRRVLLAFWEEACDLDRKMGQIEKELEGIAREHPLIRTLLEIPGIGAITATALFASVGNIHLFKSGRHLASWLGITPKEYSSGSTRRMGRISKKGDPFLRTLLIHGARSALTAAQVRQRTGKPLTRTQQWAVEKAGALRHSNQAAVALANKLARICWAVWKHERQYDGNYLAQAA
ncbi:MAG: IS110 family transposase [Gemmatimonadota bacterium]|nr:IS110 family transposase [Gemmatimonadota bacterium]